MREAVLVMRKELREWLRGQDLRTALLQSGIFVLVFGVLIPWQGAAGSALAPAALASILFVGVVLTTSFTADSFAGERERGTLETLLATPLSDAAILLGKVAAAVVYADGTALLVLAANYATGLATGRPDLVPTPAALAAFLAALLLLTVLLGIAGVFVSLRARSTRAAVQLLNLPLLGLFLIAGFGLPALLRALSPATRQALAQFLAELSVGTLVGGFLLLLLVLDAVALALALHFFGRSRVLGK